ncbi:hypothetical protein Tco_1290567 [Tanacetum coccineum]
MDTPYPWKGYVVSLLNFNIPYLQTWIRRIGPSDSEPAETLCIKALYQLPLSPFLFLVMAKQDIDVIVSTLIQEYLGALVKKYRITLDLHPRLPTPDFCISQLPSEAIDRKVIPDYMTWRHTQYCVSYDFPNYGFDPNDALRLCTCSAKLHDISEAVLVRSGLSSVWLNRKCDPVFRRKDDNIGRVGVFLTF